MCRMNPDLSKFILVPWWSFPSHRTNCGPEGPGRTEQQLPYRRGGLLSNPPVWGTWGFRAGACRAPGARCSSPFPSFSFFPFNKADCWQQTVKSSLLTLLQENSWAFPGLQGILQTPRKGRVSKEGGRRKRAIQWSWEICICQLINTVG